ncbi:hypothetical protein ACU3L3_14440 [Priestia endophytica]
MKKALLEIEYNEGYLTENNTTLENELNWLQDSEIDVTDIKKWTGNILVRFNVSGYSLTVYFNELYYDQEFKRYGKEFDEVMYDKALERMINEGASLPPFPTTYVVEPY